MSEHPDWTASEKDVVRRYYPLEGGAILARLPEYRTARALHRVANLLGVHAPRNLWTPEEDAVLWEHFPIGGSKAVHKHLPHRTPATILRRASYIGCRASDDVRSANYFRPGDIPLNKGAKGHSHPNSIKTRFKRGQQNATTLPVGTIRWRGGRWMIKVANDLYKLRSNWQQYSRWLWAQHHGPIEKGIDVAVITGSATRLEDIRIDNLRLECRAARMRQKLRNYPPELQAAIKALSSLQKSITSRIHP